MDRWIGGWMDSWMSDSNRKRSRNESRPKDEQDLTLGIKGEIPKTTFIEQNHKGVGLNGT